MKKSKKFAWAGAVLMSFAVLTGCTPNQQEIFDASMKLQKAQSIQEHVTVSFDLKSSGFDPMTQQQIDTLTTVLNGAKLDLDIKTKGNETKTTAQSEANMSWVMPGMEINMPYWVDMDLEGSTPKLTEIFKLPSIAAASFPAEYAGKEYMVMNPLKVTDTQAASPIDMAKLMEFSTNIQAKTTDFMMSYAGRYNPDLDVIKKNTSQGQTYTVKLSDAQLKELISYTVNNFAQDQEAMAFLQDYLGAVGSLTAVPEADAQELEQAIEGVGTQIPEFLDQFNAGMESLKDVPFLGDQGMELSYTINDGNIVQSTGMINISLDVAALNQLLNPGLEQGISSETAGKLDLTINYTEDVISINQPLEIEIPAVTPENSFDYFDYIQALTAAVITEPAAPPTPTEPAAPAPAPAASYTVKAGDTLGTIAQQFYGDSKYYTKLYEANKGTIADPNLIYVGQVLVIPQ